MSKYIKNIDLSQFDDLDDDEMELLYEAIEEADGERDRKQQRKMRNEYGYYE